MNEKLHTSTWFHTSINLSECIGPFLTPVCKKKKKWTLLSFFIFSFLSNEIWFNVILIKGQYLLKRQMRLYFFSTPLNQYCKQTNAVFYWQRCRGGFCFAVVSLCPHCLVGWRKPAINLNRSDQSKKGLGVSSSSPAMGGAALYGLLAQTET